MNPNHSKAARALLGWNQEQLAEAALVSKRTVAAFEAADENVHGHSIAAIERALENAGITVVDSAAETAVALSKKHGASATRTIAPKSKGKAKRPRMAARRR